MNAMFETMLDGPCRVLGSWQGMSQARSCFSGGQLCFAEEEVGPATVLQSPSFGIQTTRCKQSS